MGIALPSSHLDLGYGASPNQSLDLFLPDAPDCPLLLFAHGGAWISGDKSEHREAGEQFAGNGIAFAAVNYRLSPEVRHPAHAEGVARAYVWLADQQYGYNATQIFVVGHSAGAHIAGTLATTNLLAGCMSLPAGFIGIEGIYDIAELDRRWPTYRQWFLDKAFEGQETWDEASPRRRSVVVRAPWLLIHSKADEYVDPEQSANFDAHLRAQGVHCSLAVADFGRHDEAVMALADRASRVSEAIYDFVQGSTHFIPEGGW